MCGITGIFNLNRDRVEPSLIEEMVKSLKHRGPDDSGVYLDNNVALGHTRLSIIDLSKAGHQPMEDSEQEFFITYNGEFYNFKEVRDQLEALGHKFRSKTDTEVILYAYKQWGAACMEKIGGMFAFAIFNKEKQELFLARDRIGEKPLYYYLDRDKFVFASEIKAILCDNRIKREIDQQGMVNYFAFGHSIAPDTIYKGIKKLLPGQYLTLKNNSIEINSYWELDKAPDLADKGSEYYKQGIKELFEKSVKERLVSDVPLGVFLSGGVDSSSVVAMMAKIGVSKIKTFSVGFNLEGQEFNELVDAKFVADRFRTDHHEIVLEGKDLVGALNKLVYHFDEPFGDAANFPVYLMSKYAKEHVSVVLTGEGGDEIFGGYRRYVVEKNRVLISPLAMLLENKFLSKGLELLPGFRKTKKLINALPIKDNLLRYINWLTFFSVSMREKLLLDAKADPLKQYKKYFYEYKSQDWINKIMYLDQKILLPDAYLEKVDKASMASALETRPPILDYNLVEFANNIPSKYKVKGFKTKCIFKEAMAEFLPDGVLSKKKHGFAVPTSSWFRGELKNYLFEVVFDKKTKERGYFNYDYIEGLYKSYQDKSQPLDSQFWLLLNFELWHRQFIDSKNN